MRHLVHWVTVALCVTCVATLAESTKIGEEACDTAPRGTLWCYETDSTAVLIRDEVTAEEANGLPFGIVSAVHTYPDHRFFFAQLVPKSKDGALHSAEFHGKLGLQTSAGGVVQADIWLRIAPRTELVSIVDGESVKYFDPVGDLTSRKGRSYMFVVAFPKLDSNSLPWDKGKVLGLLIR